MKFALTIITTLVLASFLTYATQTELGIVDITNSTINSITLNAVGFGGISGTVKMKLGAVEWYPTDLWLIQEGVDIDNVSYTNKYYKVSSSLNMTNDCRSSKYIDSSGKTAFKVSVKPDGSFCLLADPGRYKIVAEYS